MDIAQKLQEYDAAFDFYMDRGQMPETIPQGDILGGIVGQAIEENLLLNHQDSLWTELLKEEVMRFIAALLQIFQPLEAQHEQEKGLIRLFADGGIEQKRKMWGQVSQTIKREYTKDQVHIDGYVEQMNPQDTEAVLASLIKDWEKACDEKLEQQKKTTVEIYKKKWKRHIREHGSLDYQEHKRIEKIVFSYPALAEIVRIMGREQPKREDEMDESVTRYLPILPSPPKPAIEIEEITTGQSLRNMMPIELAIMSDNQTEDLFYLKYASQKLQLFASKPKEESSLKVDKQRQLKPRLEKGPIIVSLDTSGSMSGKPIQLAKCLLLQLLRMAKKQKRKCYLISFSVRAKYLDLSRYGAWRMVNQFLDDHFSGGTDGEEMLNAALELLQTANFSMADVLIISDFYFPKPLDSTRRRMNLEHAKGTIFYGLQIDSNTKDYNNVLDRIWKVQLKNSRFFG